MPAPRKRSRAAPDGYTLIGGGSGPIAANASLYKSLGYDPLKDLEIISPFAGFTIVVTASTKLGVKSVKELIERAKKEPGKLELRLGRHRLVAASGRRILPAGGRRRAHPRPLQEHRAVRSRPDRRRGAARLPVVSERRGPDPGQGCSAARGRRRRIVSRQLPDTPTTTEAGLPEYKVNGWFALVAPAGTPRPILEKLNKELNDALNDPQVKAGFAKAGRRDDRPAARRGQEIPCG